MIDSALPTKSLIGTFLIVVAFAVVMVLLVATFNDPVAKWLLVPLAISLALSSIKCVSNMQEYLNLLEEISQASTRQVLLETCPDYWVKDTAYIESATDKANPTAVTVCKNYKTDAEGKTQYVGGSGRGGDSSTFVQNFGAPGQSFGQTLTEMNNRHQGKETFVTHGPNEDVKNVEQAMVSTPAFQKTDNPEYPNEYVTYHDATRTSDSAPWSESATTNTKEMTGTHYHHTGKLIHHDNSHGSHDGMKGAVWHSHANESTIPSSSMVSTDVADKWIFNRAGDARKGVEINLNKLNSASNVCELSKDFYWAEASNKCSFGTQI